MMTNRTLLSQQHHNTLFFNRQGKYFGGGFGEAETVVEPQADDPDDAPTGIDGHMDTAFLDGVEFAVLEEVAHQTAATHAERVETVGRLPRAHGEGQADAGGVDMLYQWGADSGKRRVVSGEW